MRPVAHRQIEKHFCSFGLTVPKLTDRIINTYAHKQDQLQNYVLILSANSQRGADTCFRGWLHSSRGSPGGRACLPCPGWCRHQWITGGSLRQFLWTLWGPPVPTLPLPGGKSPPANGEKGKKTRVRQNRNWLHFKNWWEFSRYPRWHTKHSTRCHIMENKCVLIAGKKIPVMQISKRLGESWRQIKG